MGYRIQIIDLIQSPDQIFDLLKVSLSGVWVDNGSLKGTVKEVKIPWKKIIKSPSTIIIRSASSQTGSEKPCRGSIECPDAQIQGYLD